MLEQAYRSAKQSRLVVPVPRDARLSGGVFVSGTACAKGATASARLALVVSLVATAILFGACSKPAPETDASPSIWKFDFGDGEVAEGFVPIGSETGYSDETGFGWVERGDWQLRDREAPDALNRDFVYGGGEAVFRLRMSPGLYFFEMTFCDILHDNHYTQIRLLSDGTVIPPLDLPVVNPPLGVVSTLAFTARVPGTTLDLQFGSPTRNWIVNSLVVRSAREEQLPALREGDDEVVLSREAPLPPASELVFDFVEESNGSGAVQSARTTVGRAVLGLLQAPALLQSPLPETPARIVFSVGLPPVAENERLTLAFAGGLSTPPDVTDVPRGGPSVEYRVQVGGVDVYAVPAASPDWNSRALDITSHAGKTIEIGFESRTAGTLAPLEVAWIHPALFLHETDGAMRILPFQNVLQYDFAEITFGPTDAMRYLRRHESPDEGISSFEVIDGVPHAKPGLKERHQRMLYYKIDRQFLRSGDWTHFLVSIDYFDTGDGRIFLEYDSIDPEIRLDPRFPGAFKRHPSSAALTDTNRTRTHAFLVREAWFEGGCNGGDFRFTGIHRIFYFSKVQVAKIYPNFQPRDTVRRTERFKR